MQISEAMCIVTVLNETHLSPNVQQKPVNKLPENNQNERSLHNSYAFYIK